jgi:hypothetical protein
VIETPDHYSTASRRGFESVSFRLCETVVPVQLFRPAVQPPRPGAEAVRLRAAGAAGAVREGLQEAPEAALRPEYHLPTTKIVGEVPVSTPGRTLQLQLTAERGLSYDPLESLLDGIPARRRLMMMDTCHSGEVDEDAVRTPPPLPGGAVRGDAGQVKLATDFRSFSYSGAIQSPDSSHEVLAQLFADLRRGSGAAVISSASGAEFALESPQWQNGVFTFSVLQGADVGPGRPRPRRTVRVSELREYVVGEVRRLTQGAQTSTSRRENLEFDFPVV